MTEYTHGQLKRSVNAIPDVFIGATFDEIKLDLLNWFKGQDEFKDYDFLGSRANVLMDFMTYGILYIQQMGNTAVTESYLGTASLRSSVVQAAQDYSYLPSSKTAAKTSLMLKVSHNLNPNNITIPRGTKFLAYAKDTSVDPYPFVVTEDVVAIKDINNQYIPIIKLAQGRVVRTELGFERKSQIIIREPNIDRSMIRVFVDGAEWTNWTRKSMVHAGSTSSIYYVRETIDGNTEIYFGEGEQVQSVNGGILESNYIGGLKPIENSRISIEYISTDGEVANGAKDFTYADTLQYITIDEVIENYNNDDDYVGADGGGDEEDIERIREQAKLKQESQMRCVTAADYDAFVSERFGSIIQAVRTFTDVNKPGYAFIPIKPKSGLYLTAVQREDIQNYLKDYNVSTITPSVMSPDYLFIKHNIKVSYEINKLQESEQWLRSKVIDSIDRYYIEEVEVFNKSFAKSKMLSYIDNSDHSIIGTSCSISMIRELQNFYITPERGIKYFNPVKDRSIISNSFKFIPKDGDPYDVNIKGTDRDDKGNASVVIGPFIKGDITENSNIKPYTKNDFDKTTVGKRELYYKIGDMNYKTDFIYWNINSIGLDSDSFEVQTIELYAEPVNDNIYTNEGSLIVFEDDLRPHYTVINMEAIARN